MIKQDREEFFRRLKEINPDAPTIFMSAYSVDVLLEDGLLDERVDVLMKPFEQEDLAARIQELVSPGIV